MNPKNKLQGVDTNQAWEKLKTRFEEDGLMPEQAVEIRFHHATPLWVKWAATLLLLIAAGTMVFLGIGNRQNSSLISLSNGSDNVTLVKTLDDGSVIYLADNTSLSFPRLFDSEERKVKMSGEAYFDVAHNPQQPFRVETANAMIEVVGTAFSVNTISDDELEVYVEEGLVRVNIGKGNNEGIMIEPGDILHIKGDTHYKTSSDGLLLALWRQNRMHFKDESLTSILSVINRNYNSNLILENDSLGQKQLTVTFYNNSLPTIIELLCLSMNLEAKSSSDSRVILVPK